MESFKAFNTECSCNYNDFYISFNSEQKPKPLLNRRQRRKLIREENKKKKMQKKLN